ncbi:M15 family metallopeptidase [Vibrio salinus]|uniref:M15 family metallopeptidase n=1 Tax=Vibrio salinus TaxID=2899784 RepID=UPI001E4DBCF7|nr:M15 family metallopeptidase [Vibrio salinus]MCE0494476.1 M15 family metallopeptidase [Vibrio salinus]
MTPDQLTGKVTTHLCSQLIGRKHFLIHQNVTDDLTKLIHAANRDGFDFHIASGFRSFEQQLTIWNGKYSGQRTVLDSNSHPVDIFTLNAEDKIHAIMKWSALPGTSRHHWGTDFDVYDRAGLPDGVTMKLEPWEYLQSHQKPFYQWLVKHAVTYGFYFPYEQDLGGVAIEPWHLSYRPVASDCLKSLSVELITQQLRDEPLLGKKFILPRLKSLYTQYISNLSL